MILTASPFNRLRSATVAWGGAPRVAHLIYAYAYVKTAPSIYAVPCMHPNASTAPKNLNTLVIRKHARVESTRWMSSALLQLACCCCEAVQVFPTSETTASVNGCCESFESSIRKRKQIEHSHFDTWEGRFSAFVVSKRVRRHAAQRGCEASKLRHNSCPAHVWWQASSRRPAVGCMWNQEWQHCSPRTAANEFVKFRDGRQLYKYAEKPSTVSSSTTTIG